jgi:hypothetical protein
MRGQLAILDEHGLGLPDIQRVIEGMAPLDGALAFLDWLRSRMQVIILSDTFAQFAAPLMRSPPIRPPARTASRRGRPRRCSRGELPRPRGRRSGRACWSRSG